MLGGGADDSDDKQDNKQQKQAPHPFANLHPYLFPIAQSQSTGNLVCAYRNPMAEIGSDQQSPAGASDNTSKRRYNQQHHPWPIVEAKLGGPGLQLLSLNSEHLMRRIVCELDFAGAHDDSASDHLVQLYNEGLGRGTVVSSLDTPYEPGSVAQLGYGVDKYVLLRVGPFPDLYQSMARQHFAKGDESSALIAAEAANGKLPGFASQFRFYARILSSFPNRQEETRDAARMCLRLPLPTIGMDLGDFEEVAVLGQLCEEHDASPATALLKLTEMYDLMRQVEEEDPHASGKTPEQQVMEDAADLINRAVLTGKYQDWSSLRPELAQMYRSIGRDDMALFIDI